MNEELLAAKRAREEYKRLCAAAYSKLDPKTHNDWHWFSNLYRAQSLIFYAELLPRLFEGFKRFQCSNDLSVLDVGGGSGAGTELLAQVFRGGLTGYTVRFTIIDIDPVWQRFSRVQNALVEYEIGDVFKVPDKAFDVVICSHTIEHVPEDLAASFVRKCIGICRKFAMFCAPFEENELIPGHLYSVTAAFVSQFKPVLMETWNSLGWQKAGSGRPSCVLFVCVP